MPLTFPQMPDKLTANETAILEYINRNSTRFLFLNIAQLAAELDVSEATISRFARHVGCRDFKHLKQVVLGQVEHPGPVQRLAATLAEGDGALPARFFAQQRYCLERTMELLDQDQFRQAAQAVADAGRVFVHAKNASRSMARLLSFRLHRIGVEIRDLPAGSELLEDLADAGPGDLVVLFNFSRLSAEGRTILELASRSGYQTLLFTGRLVPDPVLRADFRLFVYRGEETEYHSMTAPAALVDALVVEVSSRLGPRVAERLEHLRCLKETCDRGTDGPARRPDRSAPNCARGDAEI